MRLLYVAMTRAEKNST
ncbi:MAG: hypothetical protein ACLUFP_07275 [Streptococcus salivarius]